MTTMKYTFIVLFLFCFWTTGFSQKVGQTISLESNRTARAKISTNISLGGSFLTGNIEKGAISGNVHVAAVDSVKEFSFDAKYIYGENNNQVNQREYLTGLQYDYHPLSKVSPFIRMELYSNEFKDIERLYSGLLGVKYRYFVYKKDGETISDYSISGAFSYGFEKYTPNAESSNQEKIRLSVRPKFKQKLMKNITLHLEVYYKPNVNHWNDYIIHSISNINFLINRNVFVKGSYEYVYDSKPITSTIKKTDTMFLTSVGIEF